MSIRAIGRTAALAAAMPVVFGTVAAGHANAAPSVASSARAPASCAGQAPVVLEPAPRSFASSTAKGPPIYTLSYAAARKVLDTLQSGPVPLLPAVISHRTLPVGPTGKVTVRIVRPAGATGKLPAVMYFHGGGWILGDEHTHDRLVRLIANRTHAVVIFVDYTPSPEAHYPVPVEQAYAATRWVAQHGSQINVDSSRLAVAGDSVGGNMAAAVTLMAKERGGPRLLGQVMFYPVTNASFSDCSYQQFANGPWLTRKAVQWSWNAYDPDLKTRNQILTSPLRASLSQLKGLPKALVITDEADVLRDEGEAYASKLRAAGDDVTAVRYEGIFHDFVMLNALRDTNAAKSAVAQASGFLRGTLHS
jgi:acetyl esterase